MMSNQYSEQNMYLEIFRSAYNSQRRLYLEKKNVTEEIWGAKVYGML